MSGKKNMVLPDNCVKKNIKKFFYSIFHFIFVAKFYLKSDTHACFFTNIAIAPKP